MRRLLLPLAGLVLFSVACAPVLPEDPVQRALIRDVARIVEAQDQVGWTLDELEVEKTLSDAMESACRVPASKRGDALEWLGKAVADAGGDPAEVYAENGKDLSAVSHLLLLYRTQMVLRTAHQWANEDKCPFWIEEEELFRGIQGFDHRLVLAIETGGRAVGGWEGDEFGVGGGGGFRFLVGYGATDDITLLAGIHTGGWGRFTDLAFGRKVEIPELIAFTELPLVARFHQLSAHWEVEAGPLVYLNQLRGAPQVGGRLGVGVGFSRLRLKGIIPGVTFSLNYDFIPESDNGPMVHQIGGGVRATFSLSL